MRNSFWTCFTTATSTYGFSMKSVAPSRMAATAVAAMREGATDFIEKPYVDVAVLKQVQKLLHSPPALPA